MKTHPHVRDGVMLLSLFIVCICTCVSCGSPQKQLEALQEAYAQGEYARVQALTDTYLEKSYQPQWLLYQGAASYQLGEMQRASASLKLFLATEPSGSEDAMTATHMLLGAARSLGDDNTVIACAETLNAAGATSQEERASWYASLVGQGRLGEAATLLGGLQGTMDIRQFAVLAVESGSTTDVVTQALDSWLRDMAEQQKAEFRSLYLTAVDMVTKRNDATLMIALSQQVFDIYQDEATLVALGDIYAASGQRVMARKLWTQATTTWDSETARRRLFQ